MTTIPQLPPVITPGPNDLVPAWQAADGVLRGATLVQILAPAQAAAAEAQATANAAMPNTTGALTTLIGGYPMTDPHVLNAPFWNGGFLCLSQG